MASIASSAKELVSAQEISRHTGLSSPTVSKILKLLAQNGLLVSARGINGGYRLSRSLRDISVADIVIAVDGPIAVTECTRGRTPSDCCLEQHCQTKFTWHKLNVAVKNAFASVSLADVIHTKIPAFDNVNASGCEATGVGASSIRSMK